MRRFEFIVLGGGVSGLGFAKRMSERGRNVLVLEKESVVGGLSRTLYHDGFYLDFCAHRFHTNNRALLEEIRALPALHLVRHVKKSRIYMFGKYLKYPFELQNLLRAMPLADSVNAALSFGWNLLSRRFRRPRLFSYRDWFVHLYGRRLYEIMCRPYTSKIWHTDPAEISADWAEQRFQGENLKRLLKRVIRKLLTLDFSNYDLEDDSLAPDGGPFYYPQRGIQELPDALARAAVLHGTAIETGVTISRASVEHRTVTYERMGIRETVGFDQLISTIPLHAFYALQERRSAEVEEALAGLKYMDIIFVYVFLGRPQLSNDHWLYFPDPDIVFNRAVEFSNWSAEMCPPGQTSVCFDITVFADDDRDGLWSAPDHELAVRVLDDAERVGYLRRSDVTDTYVFRLRQAYPYYDLDYKAKLDTVVRFLERENVSLLGRTGVFQYNNSDNSIEMGFLLADKFLAGTERRSIYQAKVKAISY
jgi:UDP-galactopyranose mutase